MIIRQNFLLKEVPIYHPKSNKYKEWWREQKKRCIEGYWAGGRWMPGNLYYYVNFGVIKLNKTASSKQKVYGRPFLRDLEWEFFYNWAEAKGFSGFLDDEEFTAAYLADPKEHSKLTDFEKGMFKIQCPTAFDSKGQMKKYIHPRDYLRKTFDSKVGRPVYENECKDFMMMGSRGFGKSYSVGVGIVGHEFLFNGQTYYIPPEELNGEKPPSSSVFVGAGDSKYSTDILKKTEDAIKFIPGGQEIGEKYYPSPFLQQFKGSWAPGKKIVASYTKKIGGSWKSFGTESTIYHRSFSDNPFAANGLRCGTMVFEEIGMFNNLIASRNASVECQMNGAFKYGSMMFLGTGGDMDGGTLDAHQMFTHPETYNLVTFNDDWENRGKIAYFVSAEMGLNQFKDENGFTNKEAARHYLKKVREKLRKSTGASAALDDELQNRPLVPSEVFLTKKGNIFPTAELMARLKDLEIENKYSYLEKKVTLYFDPSTISGVNYKLDLDNKLTPLNNFPLLDSMKNNREGAVVIYEFPQTDSEGNVPKDLYIIGHDPYASDDPNGNSLGAVYVLKTKKHPYKFSHDEVVASFVGRPYQGRVILNDIMMKLSMFYGNAKIYFENVRGNVKEFFEKKKRLDLLATQPRTVFTKKASWTDKSSNIVYGYPMSSKAMKAEGIQYMRDWLLEERGVDSEGKIRRNLDLIPDKALLQELIAFNYTGNFDRVMAFIGCIVGLEESYNQYTAPVDEKVKKNQLEFLARNKNVFFKDIDSLKLNIN